MTRRGVLHAGLAAAGYLAAILLLAWPLPRALGSALVDPVAAGGGAWGRADLDLVVWILAWGSHALVTQPLGVFDANIFYPAPNVLASSEHLLGLAPLAAPVFLATGNPILTYNVTVLLVVLVAATSTYLLVREWTDDALAAWLAGAVFALAPLNLLGWTRLHVTAVHLFPLILLLAWRAAAAPRWGTLAGLAAVTALQLLSGVYVAFELGVLLLGALPMLWCQARRHGQSGRWVLAAWMVSAAPLVPLGLAYLHGRAVGVLPPDANAALAIFGAPGVATLLALLRASLGWPLIVLAALGLLWPGERPGSSVVRLGLIVIAALGFAVALGPSVPGPYGLAVRLVPGFSGMRAPTRFLVVPLLALSVAAGLGAAVCRRWLTPRLGHRGGTLMVALACCLVVLARRPTAPLALVPLSPAAPSLAAHRWLAAHGDGRPVLVLPALNAPMDLQSLLFTTQAMVGSTLHWQPLVNGYSGYAPPSDRLLMTLAQRLPDRDAFSALCRLVAPGWFVLHEAAMLAPAQAFAAQLPVVEVARFGSDVLLRVECDEPPTALPALRRQLGQGDDGETLAGAVRAPLGPGAARGVVHGPEVPARFGAGLHAWMWVEVENAGTAVWPGLSAWARDTVAVQARWRDPRSGAIVHEDVPVPLARDLAPGESLRAQVESTVPPPGTYELEIGLAQIGPRPEVRWFAATDGEGVFRRRVDVVPYAAPG